MDIKNRVCDCNMQW